MAFGDIQNSLKLINDSVAQLEGQVESILSSIPDPMFIIDEEGCFLNAIRGQEKSLYGDNTFLKGKKLHDVFSDQLADTFLTTINEAIKKGSLIIIDYELSHDNVHGNLIEPGKSQWFQGRVFPIKQKISERSAVVWLAINTTEKKQLENRLKEMAETDPLTGAFNRRVFFQIFNKEFAGAQRYNLPLSLLMLDIDHFKSINDRYGHDVGDLVLKEIVRVCSAKLRSADLFARYGGEEFVILFPNTPIDGALKFAERLRKDICNNVILAGENKIQISVSMGVSEVSSDDENSDNAVKRADVALYDAKNRNL